VEKRHGKSGEKSITEATKQEQEKTCGKNKLNFLMFAFY
jgi:hypothetical protein